MGGWSADNLHKPIRTNPLCECRPHLACCHAEVQFRRALRLVERQADLSTPKKAVGNGFLARFSQRNLAQHQSLRLLVAVVAVFRALCGQFVTKYNACLPILFAKREQLPLLRSTILRTLLRKRYRRNQIVWWLSYGVLIRSQRMSLFHYHHSLQLSGWEFSWMLLICSIRHEHSV